MLQKTAREQERDRVAAMATGGARAMAASQFRVRVL
jgi:hypothetical protein